MSAVLRLNMSAVSVHFYSAFKSLCCFWSRVSLCKSNHSSETANCKKYNLNPCFFEIVTYFRSHHHSIYAHRTGIEGQAYWGLCRWAVWSGCTEGWEAGGGFGGLVWSQIHVWVSRRGSRVLNVLEFIDCFGWKTLEAIGESGGDSLGTPASSRCPKTCRWLNLFKMPKGMNGVEG